MSKNTDQQTTFTLPVFTAFEMQPIIWWQSEQSHISEHKIPNVGCIHLSVQLFPKYPAGQSKQWKNKTIKIYLKSNKNR